MQSVVAYVRTLLGWCDENPTIRTSFKRDRIEHHYKTMIRIPLRIASQFFKHEDDFSSDDDSPVLKRHKKLPKTSFPDLADTKDMWSEEKPSKNIRYVQIEPGHPSTSTPIEGVTKYGVRYRTVPTNLSSNGPSTPIQKPRKHTPVRPVIQTVLDDDDDEDIQEVTWVETKPKTKNPAKVYINIDDEEDDGNDNQEDDVIFVKKVSTPPPVKPYKFFISKNNNTTVSKDNECIKYYKICKTLNNRSSISPRTYTKFKQPAGITKVYKKPPTPIPRWMQTQKTNIPHKNRLNVNGIGNSAMAEVFNLDEKRNYQELIRRVTGTIKPSPTGRSTDIVNIADESAAFRSTLRSQKSSLNEIKLLEQGLNTNKENESTKEYDPITVASINSSDSEVEVITSDASTSSSVKIDPINTLKDSYRDRAITSGDWLSKLDIKYRKKRQDTQEKLKDARRESDIISKVNYEQKLAQLEHKLKYELSIPESLIEEVQPTVELPSLTPEQEKLVNRALGPGPPGQLLVEKFNLRIHRRDLQTLSGLNWLNDEVINFYMNLLMQRSEERKDLPKVYATNTFFYPKLMQSGQAGLRRWTRKVDIFGHDLMVIPVHLGVHWCLSLIDFREKKISYLDSMGSRNQPCLEALLQYLKDEHRDKKGQPFADEGWTTENLKDIPQQMNGSDCGMFACTFAEFSSRGARYTFSQAHMPLLRRKAALEILQARLLL